MKGAGRYAVLADPQGAAFAIIDPENARAEGAGVPPLGQFSWHELATSDNEAAFAFYSNLFGWEAMQRMDMGPLGVYLIFGYDGEQKGGMYIKPPEMPGPANWLPYVHVPDVDAAVPVVEAGGGKVINGPMDVPGGSRIVAILDPAGAAIALHSYPAAAAAVAAKPAAAKKVKPAPAKAKPKAKVAVKAKVAPKPKAKAKAKVKAKPKAKAKTKAKAKAKTKMKAKTKPKARVQPKKKGKMVRRKK
jgi:predicted enzyme related to lactoylglutathione lyase